MGEGRFCVIPTCIDTGKYRPAAHLRHGVRARLVWIGQQSTITSLTMAERELSAVAARLPGMEFRQICDRSAAIAGFRVVLRPWSVAAKAADLARCDIGVAWMPDDSWSCFGKCGLKVLQYMAAGLPVVANPVGVHKEMIVHGETGFLAAAEEWAEAVTRLAADPHLRRTNRHAGRTGRAALQRRRVGSEIRRGRAGRGAAKSFSFPIRCCKKQRKEWDLGLFSFPRSAWERQGWTLCVRVSEVRKLASTHSTQSVGDLRSHAERGNEIFCFCYAF